MSRRCGRPVVFIRSQENEVAAKKKPESDDEMEVDEPAQKKTKQ